MSKQEEEQEVPIGEEVCDKMARLLFARTQEDLEPLVRRVWLLPFGFAIAVIAG